MIEIDGERYAVAELEDSTILVPRRFDLRKLYVELSSLCNLDCPHCFRRGWRSASGHMDPALWNALRAQLAAFPRLEAVHLAGVGEPTFSPHFLDAVRDLRAAGLRVLVTTNGTLLDGALAAELVALGVEEVTVSLDPESACAPLRQEGGAGLAALSALRAAKIARGARAPILRAAVVISRANASSLPRLAPVLRNAGCDRLMASHLLPTSEEMVAQTFYPISREEEDRLVRAVVVACRLHGISFELPRFRVETERHCAFAAQAAAFVRWDGEVAPCWRLLHSRDEWVLGRRKSVTAHSFGNVLHVPLDRIWTTDEFLFFRWRLRRALYASCLDCGLLEGCPYPDDTTGDCWGSTPACSDCLWDRNIIVCP